MMEAKTPTTQANKEKRTHFLHWHIVAFLLAVYDVLAVVISYFGALLLRFDGTYSEIPEKYLNVFKHSILIYAVFCLLVFEILKLYRSIWRFAGYTELLHMILATTLTGLSYMLFINVAFVRMPVSYHFFGAISQLVLTIGVRFAYRFVLLLRGRRATNVADDYQKRIMIIGAGQAGQLIQRDIKISKETSERVVCFIDDNPNTHRRLIDGVPIVGGREDILKTAADYHVDKIYVAIPSASIDDRRDILNICKETGCELLNLPGIYQLMNGEVSVSQMKEVAIEDLLGRDPIRVEMDEIYAYIEGKVIMVTGGGGSIGSELCRQIASHNPKQLIILDVYENNAYEIQQELKKNYPALKLEVLIASVRDSRRMFDVFRTYKPQIVYHAAAHKHVPLMEDSPCEAIKNNAIGTYKTAYAAMVFGAERFVLISTDKAVNPTNIMGASKRLCEMIIQAFDQKIKEGQGEQIPQLFTHWSEEVGLKEEYLEQVRNAKTEFVAVRFGNVLGSNGSVIPLFKKQIAAGGPVTVTHPDIIRYFMTIPEAVSLVMQAGTYAHGGEIFVLDMGCPVKIDTLARNLIKLSGYKPDIDIKVEYTGLRPGEKLYEEKLMAEEGLKTTKNKLIHIGCPIPFDTEVFLSQLEQLMNMSYRNKPEIISYVEQVVSTFHPAGKKGSEEKTKAYEEQKMQMAQ